MNMSTSNSKNKILENQLFITGSEKSHWWMYLQDKEWSSHALDDQTRTLPQLYWEELETKAGSSMRLAPHISSSDFLLRIPQETLLVVPLRLLFCSLKLLRCRGQESSLHQVDFSSTPSLFVKFENSFEAIDQMYEKLQVDGYVASCLLMI